MPTTKNDPYSTQMSENIFKLTNVTPVPFDLNLIFGAFNQPALTRFFEQHQTLGLDIAPFVFGFLVHVAVMLDGAELYNPDGNGYFTGMNLFVQLVGEPGTNKSGLFRAFGSSMSVLSRLFPGFFHKPVTDIINGKEKINMINLIVNNDTELALFQRLSKRENVFIFSDELDVMNTRFGVYLAGSMESDVKTFGSRLLCQGYDVVKNISRTTSSSSFHIERGSINIFGASTGNMLSSIFRQYHSSSMSDGTVSRFIYVGASAHKLVAHVPGQILSVQPNMIHILIVIRILAEYKPIFVYSQYENESEISTTVSVPDDIEELMRNVDNPISLTESMLTLKPSVIIPVTEVDREKDGIFLSSRSAMRRIIDYEHNKSLQTDKDGNSVFTPLQRAFQRKGGNKLARIGGLCYAISYAIKICNECVNFIRFGDGLFLKDNIDNQQYNMLFVFRDKVKDIIKSKLAEVPTYGADKRPLIVINKAAVHASELLYQYISNTTDALFDDKSINASTESVKNTDNLHQDIEKKSLYFEEHTILLTMASPILSKAWFNNPVTGLPYTGLFKNYFKSKTKMVLLTNAINFLIDADLIKVGVGPKRHLTAARKETYIKTLPSVIRNNPNKLATLTRIGIDINEYEHHYLNSSLPTNIELTEETVKLIVSDDDYVPYAHLFNDARIERAMEERVSNHVIEYNFVQGKKQYYIIPPSQRINNDYTHIKNLFEFEYGSSQSRPEQSSSFSLLQSSSTARNLTDLDLPNPNNPTSIFFEQELFDLEQENLESYLYSSTIESSCDLIENENHLRKRLLEDEEEEAGGHNKKCKKNNVGENEVEQLIASSCIKTNSTITIGNAHIDEHDVSELNSIHVDANFQQNDNGTFAESSTGTDFNIACDNVATTSFILNVLVDSIDHTINSNTFQTNYVQMDEVNQDALPVLTTNAVKLNISSTTDHQHQDKNEPSVINNEMDPQSNIQSSSFHGTTSPSNDLIEIRSTYDENKRNMDIDQPSIVSEKDDCNSTQNNSKILSQIYHKLILSDSIVMSKTDICIKLKHMSTSTRIRDQAIQNLVNDKLFIVGDWFSIENIKGVTNFSGYLKGYPGDDAQNQIDFASILAKYEIDFIDYEQSFKKNKVDTFPRTLDASDIKQSKWLYSQLLMDTVLANNFLKERLQFDPSAVLHSSSAESQRKKRVRPSKRFSPSDYI